MDTKIRRLARHAQELAHAFNVKIVTHAGPVDFALSIPSVDDDVHLVIAPPVTDETSYAVQLHEIGHCASPFGQLRSLLREPPPKPGCHPRDRHRWMNLMLAEEQAAWEWARHYALYWSVAMEMVEQQTYDTYRTAKARTR